jgi:hypothetical protein
MRNLATYVCQLYQNISALNEILTPAISMEGLSVMTRLPEVDSPTLGSSLGPQEYPHRPTHVFPAHFVLTHAHPGRTSWSITHHSKPSTPNFGVFSDGLSEKKLQFIGMSILTNSIKPWVGMSHTLPLEDRHPR